LQVHEIKEVSESRYVEDPVASIGPGFRNGLLGTHHLSTNGNTTVVDHVSYAIAPGRLFRAFRKFAWPRYDTRPAMPATASHISAKQGQPLQAGRMIQLD
jgi:hypothetical protein